MVKFHCWLYVLRTFWSSALPAEIRSGRPDSTNAWSTGIGLFALPVNGLTTGTLNWQTFSHLAFAFRITPPLLAIGVGFALLMGVVGGLPPAIRAARLPVATALRDL